MNGYKVEKDPRGMVKITTPQGAETWYNYAKICSQISLVELRQKENPTEQGQRYIEVLERAKGLLDED